MDIFEVMDRFDPESPTDENEMLLWYLSRGDEARASPLLDSMGMLDRDTAEKSLMSALKICSAELFGKLLDHVPRREYVGWWKVGQHSLPSVEWPEGAHAEVGGTLPTLAAAMGKAEHLRLLLDWGCDVNGASQDAATALANKNYVWPEDRGGPLLRGFPTARCESVAWWMGLELNTVLFGLTPLAAGIAFGNPSCVRLLLEREGVWLMETPAVSEALTLRGKTWDTEAYQTCRRLVRTWPDGSPHPLALWAVIRHMDAAMLRDELEYCAYGREELTRAALALMDRESDSHGAVRAAVVMVDGGDRSDKKWSWEMLSLLGERDLDALRDERVQRRIAALIYCDFDGKYDPLPKVVEQALGDTVDLDEGTVGNANYSAPLAEICLERFGENRRLVMSRDMVRAPSMSPITASYLRVLLRYVEFRAPSLPVGVSGLTKTILQCGDVRLLRHALVNGLIPAEEPTERLLAFAGKNTAMRSLLLTWQRLPLGYAPAGAESSSCRDLSEDEEKRVLADPTLRAAASDVLLLRLLENCNRQSHQNEQPLCWDVFTVHDYTTLCALRGETDTVLRYALGNGGKMKHLGTAIVHRTDMPRGNLRLALLCCAAMGGQTETVRALLDAGFDPEERDIGQPSELFSEDADEVLSLSPLLCALLWERWDTAVLLLERGARSDLTSHTVRKAFEMVRGGDVPYADIRRELGAYLADRRLRRMN